MPRRRQSPGGQPGVEPTVDGGVEAADEERRDRADRRRSCPAAGAPRSPASQASCTSRYRSTPKISVTLTLIPAARVAVTAGSPASVAGILTIRLGRSTSRPDLAAPRRRRLGVEREPRVDLEGDATVDRGRTPRTRRRGRHRRPHVVAPSAVRSASSAAAGRATPARLGVGARPSDGRGEDRRVGGDATDADVVDEAGQLAGVDPVTAEVVEPDRDTLAAARRGSRSWRSARTAAEAGRAASTTASAVMPNSRRAWPGRRRRRSGRCPTTSTVVADRAPPATAASRPRRRPARAPCGGSTESRYSRGCCANHSRHGIETTRAATPSAARALRRPTRPAAPPSRSR